MNTIKCRIKINDYQDIAGEGVTPAEVILLRTIHDPHAGGNCIKNAVPAGIALTVTARKPGKKVMKDTEGNEIEVSSVEETTRERTDAEELQRLRLKYQVRARSGAPGTHICDDLFGGAGVVPNLPKTFAELPPRFAVEIAAPPAADKPKEPDPATVTTPPGNPRADLEKETKDGLLEIAEKYGIPPTESAGMKKAELVDAILAKAGYAAK